jgi:hypothetical protein
MSTVHSKPSKASDIDLGGLKISTLQQYLAEGETRRDCLIDFIEQRHTKRFFSPIECLRNAQSHGGFAMMALCCLLIETLQSYRDGLPSTDRRELGDLRKEQVPAEFRIPGGKFNGNDSFKLFFEDFGSLFPGTMIGEFYEKIRCGLLHQAQTKGKWTLNPSGDLCEIVGEKRNINRNLFADQLRICFAHYTADLRFLPWNHPTWVNARRKLWWLARLSES